MLTEDEKFIEWMTDAADINCYEAKDVKRLLAIIEAQKVLADERNMISDLIMAEGGAWINCVLLNHDAHSFWSAVRKAHAELLPQTESSHDNEH
jgi:hypothetical protein